MKYHKTWWGKEFVQALEGFIDEGRLQRGKAYRSDKRILKFDIKANCVAATIRGNINPYFGVTKEPRYRVSLEFKAIPMRRFKQTIARLADNAGWLSKLMLNEIPHDIDCAFDNDHLLPKSYKDVKATCNCPDYDNPCKHIAGVYYKIANLLDSQPMLLFSLRGIDSQLLHDELKKTPLGHALAEQLSLPEDIDIEYNKFLFEPIETRDTPLATNSQEQFWQMGAWESEDKPQDEATEISAALIKKQGDYPPFWDKSMSFVAAMEEFYQATRKKNQKLLPTS